MSYSSQFLQRVGSGLRSNAVFNSLTKLIFAEFFLSDVTSFSKDEMWKYVLTYVCDEKCSPFFQQVIESTFPVKVKSAPQRKPPGFQAHLVCLTAFAPTEPVFQMTSLTLNSSYGL